MAIVVHAAKTKLGLRDTIYTCTRYTFTFSNIIDPLVFKVMLESFGDPRAAL